MVGVGEAVGTSVGSGVTVADAGDGDCVGKTIWNGEADAMGEALSAGDADGVAVLCGACRAD
jgi:hypothetical protein